jgi:hypothetical protein
MDRDLREIAAKGFVQFLKDNEDAFLSDAFWNVRLVQSLETSAISSPFYNTYIAAQNFFGDRSLLSNSSKVYDLVAVTGDVHHIFPKDYLQKNGHNNRGEYNQIANFAMLQTEVNIQISNRAPIDYMQSVLEQCNGGENVYGEISDMATHKKNMAENCIPSNFSTIDVSNYDDFLKARRVLMAKKLKEYFEPL